MPEEKPNGKPTREDLIFLSNSINHIHRSLVSLEEELAKIIEWTHKRVEKLDAEKTTT